MTIRYYDISLIFSITTSNYGLDQLHNVAQYYIISFLHDGTTVNTSALLPHPALQLCAQHRLPLQFACS